MSSIQAGKTGKALSAILAGKAGKARKPVKGRKDERPGWSKVPG